MFKNFVDAASTSLIQKSFNIMKGASIGQIHM